MNKLRLFFIFFTLIFLTGCFQTTALLGPGVTVISTGNVFQAGLQYGANTAIKNETGKYPLMHIKETVEETGLILGKKARIVSHINDDEKNNGITIMSKRNLIPDLAKLSYLGRAITPTFSPIRFSNYCFGFGRILSRICKSFFRII